MLEQTYAKLINGQFFVVYRNHASRKRTPYLYKLDGDFISHKDWLAAMVAAESGAQAPEDANTMDDNDALERERRLAFEAAGLLK